MPAEMQPPADYPIIVAGSTWIWRYLAHDDETFDDFNWTATPGRWQVEAEIRDRDEQLLARLANFGSPAGTITLAADGVVELTLPAAVTATLPWTRTYTNSTDPRVAGWRNRGSHAYDLVAIDTTTSERLVLVHGFVTVQQPVTE